MSIEIYTIRVEDQFIIYRPLRRLAFVGNRALATLCRRIAEGTTLRADVPGNGRAFLYDLDFFSPDPPPPALPDHTFRPCYEIASDAHALAAISTVGEINARDIQSH